MIYNEAETDWLTWLRLIASYTRFHSARAISRNAQSFAHIRTNVKKQLRFACQSAMKPTIQVRHDSTDAYLLFGVRHSFFHGFSCKAADVRGQIWQKKPWKLYRTLSRKKQNKKNLSLSDINNKEINSSSR